jgi:hypothetical protein
MLFSSSRRTVCTPCLLFLKEIKIFIKTSPNREILIFVQNSEQGLQTVRLDELNNLVIWNNISFIFLNWAKS